MLALQKVIEMRVCFRNRLKNSNIDQIPVVVCPSCGESYMTSHTIRQVERLKLHKRSMKPERVAPVISYV